MSFADLVTAEEQLRTGTYYDPHQTPPRVLTEPERAAVLRQPRPWAAALNRIRQIPMPGVMARENVEAPRLRGDADRPPRYPHVRVDAAAADAWFDNRVRLKHELLEMVERGAELADLHQFMWNNQLINGARGTVDTQLRQHLHDTEGPDLVFYLDAVARGRLNQEAARCRNRWVLHRREDERPYAVFNDRAQPERERLAREFPDQITADLVRNGVITLEQARTMIAQLRQPPTPAEAINNLLDGHHADDTIPLPDEVLRGRHDLPNPLADLAAVTHQAPDPNHPMVRAFGGAGRANPVPAAVRLDADGRMPILDVTTGRIDDRHITMGRIAANHVAHPTVWDTFDRYEPPTWEAGRPPHLAPPELTTTELVKIGAALDAFGTALNRCDQPTALFKAERVVDLLRFGNRLFEEIHLVRLHTPPWDRLYRGSCGHTWVLEDTRVPHPVPCPHCAERKLVREALAFAADLLPHQQRGGVESANAGPDCLSTCAACKVEAAVNAIGVEIDPHEKAPQDRGGAGH